MPVVALLTESVDRNCMGSNLVKNHFRSLSSRRAWIEIDGNTLSDIPGTSLSSRRAWIEIMTVETGYWGTYSRSPHGERG